MLDSIVNVNISRETAAVSQAGFGTALILGTNAAFANNAPRTYTSLAAVAEDFNSSTDEYKAAAKLFGQTPKVERVIIGKMLTKVAQVVTITPTAANAFEYTITIGGVEYSFTSDSDATVEEIVTGLKAAINADSDCLMAATGTTTVILTAKTAGVPSTVSVGSNLAAVNTTANVGVTESLAGLSLVNNDWYALVMTSKTDADILLAAAYIEAVAKIYGVSKGDAGLLDASSTTDIGYRLKAANYFRTFVMYSADYANFPEAALLGKCLPYTPGSESWAFKTLAGITVDTLTATQIAALQGKNVNFYIRVGGVSVTQEGKTAGGEWIDVIRLIDLITARMQEAVFGKLVRSPKIPFTNGGIAVVENEVGGVLKANQKTGGIAPDEADENGDLVPGYSVDFPKVSEISANDRAARRLTGGSFTARIAGAIHAVVINGTVTV